MCSDVTCLVIVKFSDENFIMIMPITSFNHQFVFSLYSNDGQIKNSGKNTDEILLWKTLMRSVTAQQLENSHGLFFSFHFVWLCPGSGCCCCYYDNRVHFNKHSGVLSMFFWCWAGWWSKNRNDIIVDFSGVGVSTL